MASTTTTTTTTTTTNAAGGGGATTTTTTTTSTVTSPTTSRTVHPSVLSVAGAARGVEFSTWARLVPSSSSSSSLQSQQQQQPWLVTAAASTIRCYAIANNDNNDDNNNKPTDTMSQPQARLQLVESLSVHGTINFLTTLQSPTTTATDTAVDALVVGWTGSARVSLVTYCRQTHALQATALVDFTASGRPNHNNNNNSNNNNNNNNNSSNINSNNNTNWTTTDALYTVQQHGGKQATLCAVLDGGSRVALASLAYHSGSWHVPQESVYALPLYTLATHLPNAQSTAAAFSWAMNQHQHQHNLQTTQTQQGTLDGTTLTSQQQQQQQQQSNTQMLKNTTTNPLDLDWNAQVPLATQWGEIWSAAFLAGDRLDAQILLLHGHVQPSHRLAAVPQQQQQSLLSFNKKAVAYVTCSAVAPLQQRAAWLWTTPVPTNALEIHTVPTNMIIASGRNNNNKNASSSSSSSYSLFVVRTVNAILTLNAAGQVCQHLAVNGWAHTTPTMSTNSSSSSVGVVVPPPPTANPAVPLAIALDGATWTWWMQDPNGRGDPNNKMLQKDSTTTTIRALVVLRHGHVYVWQPLPVPQPPPPPGMDGTTSIASTTSSSSSTMPMYTLLPTGVQLENMGQVAHASTQVMTMIPPPPPPPPGGATMTNHHHHHHHNHVKDKSPSSSSSTSNTATTGWWLVGSRLGDSHLVAVQAKALTILPSNDNNNDKDDKDGIANPSMESPFVQPAAWQAMFKPDTKIKMELQTAESKIPLIKQEDGKEDDKDGTEKPIALETLSATSVKSPVQQQNDKQDEDAYEAMLRREEEALYGESMLVPEAEEEEPETSPSSKRPKTKWTGPSWMALEHLSIVDTLVNTGPIGPATEGPVAATPEFLQVADENEKVLLGISADSNTTTTAATAHVVPVGWGTSGGLAWSTLPGRDDRCICAEQDVSQVAALFGLPSLGMVCLAMEKSAASTTSIRMLNIQGEDLSEMNKAWIPKAMEGVVLPQEGQLLLAQELSDDTFWMLTHHEPTNAYEYWILQKRRHDVGLVHQGFIESHGHLKRTTSAPAGIGEQQNQKLVALVWTSGSATILTLDPRQGIVSSVLLEKLPEPMKIDDDPDRDEDTRVLREFYAQTDIVAADVFVAPRSTFGDPERDASVVQPSTASARSGSPQSHTDFSSDFDDDDLELYGLLPRQANNADNETFKETATAEDLAPATFVAICRQSGTMEIYITTDKGEVGPCVFSCQGAAQGYQTLDNRVSSDRVARSHMVSVCEMKFFSCGPSLAGSRGTTPTDTATRSIYLAMETSLGDILMYNITKDTKGAIQLIRHPLGTVTRASLEQGRHKNKLSRKGIIAKNDDSATKLFFQYNSLLTFQGLSGQDGLVVMVPRPFWVVAERGYPCTLYHRARHSAPAGGKPKVLNGFCQVGKGKCLTLHERVGRVGSQRMTLFNGISKVFESQGILTSEGISLERKILGVTVRKIEFIDDPSISTGDHPLFALLVSREMEVDQSELNDDGLTNEERKRAKKEKENAKIKRQVEADLGGFDFEHEWVEEITREDAFQVDQSLGGAPPIHKEAYSLWIVDAANKWQVVDSFDLNEYEHGMTLSVMSLSNFKEEPGSKSDPDEEDVPEDLDETLFIAVGTGVVDHNGEDVTGKGRALLFEVTRLDKAGRRSPGRIASLSLVYEKEIFHGPVTVLTCLSAEGRNRLIIGAGADVNLEQWGNNKLTQVGFFRATMQISDIRIFKNFLLLSDAYDSLHLLVYRESDKSLTLLAKEYEPVAVYAAGLMSRGPSVTFLCHDDRQNVQFLQYAPGEAAARGGNKLVCRADFHLGTQTIHFGNHFCRSSLLAHSATPTSTLAALHQQDSYFGRADDDQRISVHYGTTDGTMGAIVPLSEPVFWRLAALQSVLANALEPNCGLSPRAWRLYRRSARRGGCRSNDRKKSVIDGDLVRHYCNLSVKDQEDLASAVGSTVDAILDNLLELQCGSLMI